MELTFDQLYEMVLGEPDMNKRRRLMDASAHHLTNDEYVDLGQRLHENFVYPNCELCTKVRNGELDA
jgi:hypothetical protein